MKISINYESVISIFRNFYDLTGIQITLYSPDLDEILSYPSNCTGFCQLIKMHNKKNCDICQKNAKEIVLGSNNTYTYTCHAGLMESITPIINENYECVAYLIISQFVQNTPSIDIMQKRMLAKCLDYTLDKTLLEEYFNKLPVFSNIQIEAAIKLIKTFTETVVKNMYISIARSEYLDAVTSYIKVNLKEDLNAESISNELLIPKNTVYQCVKEETGKSLGKFILQFRLNHAMHLLLTTNLAVAEISYLCGIIDFNYFSRRFKAECGMSPREYRNKYKSSVITL